MLVSTAIRSLVLMLGALLSHSTMDFHGGRAYMSATTDFNNPALLDVWVECDRDPGNPDSPCLDRLPFELARGDAFTQLETPFQGKNKVEHYQYFAPAGQVYEIVEFDSARIGWHRHLEIRLNSAIVIPSH